MINTKIIKIDKNFAEPKKIKEAVRVLKSGGIVAFPTETVYGLGANLKNENAVAKLYEVKNRPKDKPFSILVGDISEIDKFAVDVLPAAYRLVDIFWPGPLTVVLKSKDSSTVGLRMPDSIFVLELIRSINFPIACPSANLSGKREAISVADILKDLDGKIDLILDGGEIKLSLPSTVLDARSLPFNILRQGFIKEDEIKEIYTKKRIIFICTGNSCRSVMAKALFEKRLKEKNRNDIEVDSAGVSSSFVMGATFETQQLLKEEGLDVSGHQSHRVDIETLKRCDLILVMERSQEEKLLHRNPHLKNRVYLLKEFSKFDEGDLEVKDPMGRGMEVYRKTLSEIKEAIERLVDLV